jgi:hypothetical protein
MLPNRSGAGDVLGVEVGAGPAGTPCVDLILPDGRRLQIDPAMAGQLGGALIDMGQIAAQLANYVQTN